MFDDFQPEDVALTRQMYKDGKSPAEILRFFALREPEASVPDLWQLLRDAFSLELEDVSCVGGWWHDGSGELSDAQINAFIAPAIERSADKWQSRDP